MDLLEAARVESINILKEMAEGIWTGEHLDNPSESYLMAWSHLRAADYIVNEEIRAKWTIPNFEGGYPQTIEPKMAGWTISLSGLTYLRELTTHPLKLHFERHWFPILVASSAIISSLTSAVALFLKG